MDSRVIEVRTGGAETVVDLTSRVEQVLRELAGAGRDGLCHVFVPHATAGLALIETGSGSEADLIAALRELLPVDFPWRHAHGSAGHGRSHVLPAFLAPFLVLPVLGGRLELGTWQRVCLVDLNVDNPLRSVRVSFLAG